MILMLHILDLLPRTEKYAFINVQVEARRKTGRYSLGGRLLDLIASTSNFLFAEVAPEDFCKQGICQR